jgi:hypothetical protein
MHIDPDRGTVRIEILTGPAKGRKRWISPLDAREQLANGDIRLVEAIKKETAPEEAKTRSLLELRELAKAADVSFVGKSRTQLETELGE